jgi:hypothetical protein
MLRDDVVGHWPDDGPDRRTRRNPLTPLQKSWCLAGHFRAHPSTEELRHVESNVRI